MHSSYENYDFAYPFLHDYSGSNFGRINAPGSVAALEHNGTAANCSGLLYSDAIVGKAVMGRVASVNSNSRAS